MQTKSLILLSFLSFGLTLALFTGTALANANNPKAENTSEVLADYLTIQDALATDSMTGIAQTAAHLEKAAKKLKSMPGDQISKAAQALMNAATLTEARRSFKELSLPLTQWATSTRPQGIITVSCSMAGATWLQKDGKVRNPYYGKAMLECGEVEKR